MILPIIPPQGIWAWLWAFLPKLDSMLPDIIPEFVHSITLHKSVCDVNSDGGKLQVFNLPEFRLSFLSFLSRGNQ